MITYNQVTSPPDLGGAVRNVVAWGCGVGMRGPCGPRVVLSESHYIQQTTLSLLHHALLRESATTTHLQEKDLVRRWYALPPGTLLPLSNGHSYQLIFAGRPGSALGPDVRDVVLHPDTVGDVELHIHASDWFAHLHHRDARYNNVILHVVLTLDDPTPTMRQDGTIIPTCSLHDVSPLPSTLSAPHTTGQPATWPCQAVIQEMRAAERDSLLMHAGLLRFEQKTHAFVEQLHNTNPPAYDTCLILALSEGFGYGRDRAFFRAAGSYLLGLTEAGSTPEPLGRTPDPPPLDTQRLRTLANLVSQWRTSSAWQTIKTTIPQIHSLRSIFSGLSTARCDILICNVVLPFAAAVALLEHDDLLFEQARALYQQYPSLSSNQVTRAMCKQLHLRQEPNGACQQQGLHYIYQQTCRQKHCAVCMMGRPTL